MRIGDLARRAGCTVETVRYYEKEGLLAEPARGGNNYRLYGAAHLEALSFIRNCRLLEMSLEEIRMLLRLKSDPARDCSEVNVILDEHIAHVTGRIESLETLRGQLEGLRSLCVEVRSAGACAILRELAEPGEPDDGRPEGAGAGCASHVRGAHARGAKPA